MFVQKKKKNDLHSIVNCKKKMRKYGAFHC